MWSASIKEKSFSSGVLKVVVTFTNGTETFDKDFDMTGGTQETLAQKVKAHLGMLNTSASALESIATGAFTPPADSAASEVEKDVLKLKKLQRAIDLGIIAASNATYTATLTAVKNHPLADVLKLL